MPTRALLAPRLGLPVDLASPSGGARSPHAQAGLTVDERRSTQGRPLRPSLLWVRTIAIHYAAIARYWKDDGIDLVGEHGALLTPQFRSMLTDYNAVTAVDHALDDVLRTQVQDGLEDVFEDYDFIVSPTLALPAVKNAADGNTIGPVEIEGRRVEPLIGWCMTYPINFTGHPAISVPAGLTPESGGPADHRPTLRRRRGTGDAGMYERLRPWFGTYPGLNG